MASSRYEELVQLLEAGVDALAESSQWRRHLEIESRFPRYSLNNLLLIGAQRPDATRVAGFRAWQSLNRCVRRGEKAIWIVAPILERDRAREDGRRLRGFRCVPVFDVAQTEGAEIEEIVRRLRGDDPEGLFARLAEAAGEIGFRVESHRFADGVNGDCNHTERRIRVEGANAPAQRVKTLAHELAHALLHESVSDRARAELEAESVAYVVCRSFGIDSGEYSFGYVATWAGGCERARESLRSCAALIATTASAIVSGLRSAAEVTGDFDAPRLALSTQADRDTGFYAVGRARSAELLRLRVGDSAGAGRAAADDGEFG